MKRERRAKRADRLLATLLLLHRHGRLTAAELATRLGISERAVRKDLETLGAAGLPVYPSGSPDGGWELDSAWRAQLPGFDEGEMRALLMAQPRSMGDERLAEAAESALAKLMATFPEAVRERAVFLRERLYVDTTAWLGTVDDLSMLPVIQDAVARDRKLAMRYWRAGRELVERVIDPLGLVAKGSTWYLYARTPDGYRTYRVSRIEHAEILDVACDRPADFDLAKAWKCSTEEFREEVTRELEEQRRINARRREAERRTAQELEIAKQVQARLFPQNRPAMSTLDYAGVCIQAREVGGDYYDFLNLGEERLGLVIADISGKGIAAALLMANLQANLRSQCAVAADRPERLLESVNRLFYENTTDSAYATLFFAEYDGRSRRMRYANCGHLAPLLLRDGGELERLESTCTVLGLFHDWNCTIHECTLAPGDRLLLYTDGVTEAFNSAEEEFGEARLMDAYRRQPDSPAAGLLDALVCSVREFSQMEQHDDITLMVARCR